MFSRSPPSGSGRREALASGNLPNVLQDGRRPQSAGVRPWRQERVLEGPPIKLSDGLARTKTEPISMPATPTIPVSSIRVRCANGNSVRPDGAVCQWRKVPPSELSVALVADERFGGATYRAEAS